MENLAVLGKLANIGALFGMSYSQIRMSSKWGDRYAGILKNMWKK
jgi:hypothetical protein